MQTYGHSIHHALLVTPKLMETKDALVAVYRSIKMFLFKDFLIVV